MKRLQYLLALIIGAARLLAAKESVSCGGKDTPSDNIDNESLREKGITGCATLADNGQWSDCTGVDAIADACPCTCDAFSQNKQVQLYFTGCE